MNLQITKYRFFAAMEVYDTCVFLTSGTVQFPSFLKGGTSDSIALNFDANGDMGWIKRWHGLDKQRAGQYLQPVNQGRRLMCATPKYPSTRKRNPPLFCHSLQFHSFDKRFSSFSLYVSTWDSRIKNTPTNHVLETVPALLVCFFFNVITFDSMELMLEPSFMSLCHTLILFYSNRGWNSKIHR